MRKLFLIIMIFMSVCNVVFSQTEKYDDEVVFSKSKYPKDYDGPKDIIYQIYTLAEMFGLNPTHALKYSNKLPILPEGAEGWFAVPKITAIAKLNFPEVKSSSEQYCKALMLICDRLEKSRIFVNLDEAEIAPCDLRQSFRTLRFWDTIETLQSGDILIIPAQFGMLHRGESARRSMEIFSDNEFGLGAFHVGCMSLVHPERYSKAGKLYVDCPGDYIDIYNGVTMIPAFYSDGSLMYLDCYDDVSAEPAFGSASAFMP
jgi:hypothetical protein